MQSLDYEVLTRAVEWLQAGHRAHLFVMKAHRHVDRRLGPELPYLHDRNMAGLQHSNRRSAVIEACNNHGRRGP